MYKKLRGFNDWSLGDGEKFYVISQQIINHFKSRGYAFVELPIVESIELFKRLIGNETEIVEKEMFHIKTKKKNREWVLRPEMTAQIARMFLEKNFINDISQHTHKFCYFGPAFRYERPQYKRYRQFYSFGVEYYYQLNYINRNYVILELINDIIQLFKDTKIKFIYNWLPNKLSNYQHDLEVFFRKNKKNLCKECTKRLNKNVLRILDCKNPTCASHSMIIPNTLNYLTNEERKLFENIKKSLIDKTNIQFIQKESLVRGLDYYDGFIFEIVLLNDEQNHISCLGGGEYNSLLNQMNIKNNQNKWNSLGFGLGFERVVDVFKVSKQKKLLIISQDNTINVLHLREKLILQNYNITIRFSKKNFGRNVEWALKNGFTHILNFDNYVETKNLKEYEIITLDNFKKEKIIC